MVTGGPVKGREWREWHALCRDAEGGSQPAIKSSVTKDDEAAAMAAMFQASAANWEETQEKMSQLVSPPNGFHCPCSSLISSNERIFSPSIFYRGLL